MWTKTSDGSVVDPTGKVIFFSTERFVKDICLGSCCFICGAKPGDKEFNDEHILPEWLLRRYDLFSRTITLPNDVEVRYDRYTIPCCAECNAFMGKEVEEPISNVVRGGADAINDFAIQGNLLKLFVWMGLIFLKTHLKDRALRFHLDERIGDQKIADDYDWEYLHHIHSIVRCFYNDCLVEKEAVGSFLSIPTNAPEAKDDFDFGDLYQAQTMLLRFGDIALMTVFDDSGGALSYLSQKLKKIRGPVDSLQARELMIELAFLNLHLRYRPSFQTEYDLENETCRIVAQRPDLALKKLDKKVRGDLFLHMMRPVLPNITVPGLTKNQVIQAIKTGTFTFLFNDAGEFISEAWTPL